MAKKTTKSAAASRRKISLKKIVAEIDKVLSEVERKPQARSERGGHDVARAKLALRSARDAVESACLPEFTFPDA